MATGVDLSSAELLRFAGQFVGARAGDAWVAAAHAEVRYDGEEPYVRLSLSLGPPPADRDTWTTDDMFELRQEVRRRIAASGVRDVVISYSGDASDEDDEVQPAEGVGKGETGGGSAVE
jgi:hypothetical protein